MRLLIQINQAGLDPDFSAACLRPFRQPGASGKCTRV